MSTTLLGLIAVVTAFADVQEGVVQPCMMQNDDNILKTGCKAINYPYFLSTLPPPFPFPSTSSGALCRSSANPYPYTLSARDGSAAVAQLDAPPSQGSLPTVLLLQRGAETAAVVEGTVGNGVEANAAVTGAVDEEGAAAYTVA